MKATDEKNYCFVLNYLLLVTAFIKNAIGQPHPVLLLELVGFTEERTQDLDVFKGKTSMYI